MSEKSRPGRCWYCGNEHLAQGDPPEHVIPAAIGGTLTTDRVARSCNNELGKRIDQPFLNDWFIALERVMYRISDPRRARSGRPPNPDQIATLEDGTPVRIETREGPWTASVIPSLEKVDEKTFQIRAENAEQAELMMKTKLERLERDGVDVSKVEVSQEIRQDETPVVNVRAAVDSTIRVRAAARIGLGALSRVLPETWLDSPDAQRLIGWLWEDDPKTIDGTATAGAGPGKVPQALQLITQPPEHAIIFLPASATEIFINIVLFGSEILPLKVDLNGAPRPTSAVILDPTSGRYIERSWELLVADAVRAADAGQRSS